MQALISLAAALRSAVQQHQPQQQHVYTVNDFLFHTGLDGINIFKVLRSGPL